MTQLENVKNFIEYVSKLEDIKLNAFVMPLHLAYISAAHFLINVIKYTSIPLWNYNTNYNDSYDEAVFRYENSDGNPLHLLLAAGFVEGNLKSLNKDRNKWNLEVNRFVFFERFLETKMKKRFQEKNEMNIYNPDIINTYDRELADFVLKHKKLAAYTILNLYRLDLLFRLKDLKEIKETIKLIEKGGEKTGLIYSVAYGIPVFIHMTITEHLAVEYICDRLKNENNSAKQISLIDFLLNVIFSYHSFSYIRAILDHKIKVDKTLMNILEDNKEVICDVLMKQGRLYSINTEINASLLPDCFSITEVFVDSRTWALSNALHEQLHNFLTFFLKILKCYINKNNLDDFLVYVKNSKLLSLVNINKSIVLMITFVFDIVRNIDETKFTTVLYDNFGFFSKSTVSSYLELSSQEIVDILLKKLFNLDAAIAAIR